MQRELRRIQAEVRKTILFVTHDMGAVARFCDRAMLLERGKVLDVGDPHEIGLLYNQVNFGDPVHKRPESDGERSGQPVEIRTCWFEADGTPVIDIPHGERLSILTEVRFNERIEDPVFGLSLRNDVGHTVFATTSQWERPATGSFGPGETATVQVHVDAWFAPGRYEATPSVARAGSGADTLDLREQMASFILHSTRVTGGVIDPPHSFEIERAGQEER